MTNKKNESFYMSRQKDPFSDRARDYSIFNELPILGR